MKDKLNIVKEKIEYLTKEQLKEIIINYFDKDIELSKFQKKVY